MDLEEFDEVALFLLASDSLKFKNSAEICIVAIGNMKKIGLNQSLWGRGSNLESFKECIDFKKARVDAFGETGWSW
jgi:hypothetical protein